MNALAAGFPSPVLDAQSCFRAVLHALSRPGQIARIVAQPQAPKTLDTATASVLLTLADADTPVWSDAGAEAADWLRFHAGCALTDVLSEAKFVLATGPAPALELLYAGSEEEPQGSATLILQVQSLTAGDAWILRGPGVATTQRLCVAGMPPQFLAQWRALSARSPRGVDVILCARDGIAALPRSVSIEEG